MSADVVEMLVYLCENGLAEIVLAEEEAGQETDLPKKIVPTPENREELVARFSKWLQRIPVEQVTPLPSIRIFTEEESEVMSGSCRETLLHLERLGIVDPICREIVIDYLMALDSYQVGLDDLKWAVAMAFMTDQSAEDAFWEEVDPDSASEGEAHWLFQDDTLNIH